MDSFPRDTLPEWPDVLLTLILQPSSNGRRSEPISETIPVGERNDTLFREASRMRRVGFDLSAIRDYLELRNHRCDPPLAESELDTIAQSACRYPTRSVPKTDLPKFPIEAIPEPLRSYVVAAGDAIGCPPEMIVLPGLTFAAAAIGRTRAIQVKHGWEEFGVPWFVTVAPPGSAKTPALKAAMQPLHALQRAAKAEYDAAYAAWEKKKKAKDPDLGPEPRMKHYWTSDVTPEALASLLDASDGIIIIHDELVALVKGFDRYRNKDAGERQRFLSLWSSAAWKLDRKTAGSILIEDPVVAITGGIQPDVLPELSTEAGRRDGFIERFLFSVPDVAPLKWNEKSVDQAILYAVIERFRKVPFTPSTFAGAYVDQYHLTLSEEAKAPWIDWHDQQGRHAAEASGLMSGVLSKSISHCARLMLVLQVLADPASREITRQTFESAVKLMDYFLAHTAYVLSVIEPSRQQDRVLTILLEHGGWMSTTEITNATGRHLSGQRLSGILSDLHEQGMVDSREIQTAGRPRTEWCAADRSSTAPDMSEERITADPAERSEGSEERNGTLG